MKGFEGGLPGGGDLKEELDKVDDVDEDIEKVQDLEEDLTRNGRNNPEEPS